jgi:glycosyltransferase involved in cell wall biosynthesis
LRFLAFRYPSIGNRLAEAFKRVLPVLEFFWLFRFWQGLLDHLLDYWYWRGVATIAQPQMIRKMFSARYSHSPKILLDLAPGIDAAQHHLDRTRPTSASIFVGMNWVGDIPDFPGMERLRGEHLSRILATEMSGRLSMALSLAKLIPEQEWRFLTESEKLILRYGETHRSKKIVEIELSNGIPDIDVTGFDGLHALVRIHGQPLGCVTFSVQNETRIPTMALHQSIMSYLGWEAIPYVLGTPPSVCTTWPPISVIVCTRNRTSQLAGCLQALLELDYPRYEILVIDNAPSDDRTARLAAHLPVRYIREEQPGLGWARNRGLREAHHSIVAFIDEDAQADRGWLRAIAQTFNDPEVMAVTGSVLPAKLETQAQNLFEFGYGGMNHGFRRRIFRRANSNDAQLLWASRYGAGTNMAFRKSLFDELGSFDVALGVGTPSGGGGDVEMLYRVVARGYTLVYEPAALVWHTHRPQMSDLEKLVRNNGQSFGCFLLTCARNRTVSKAAILGFALHSWLWGWIGKRLVQPGSSGFPKRLVWLELMAALGSPFAYLRSQAHARRQSHRSESKIGVKYLTTEKGTR